MDNLILAIAMGTGLTFSLIKLFGLKLLRYEFWIDLLFTIGLPVILSGTFAGGVVSVFAGITMSFQLLIIRIIMPKSFWCDSATKRPQEHESTAS
ncbi:MAG: hypothetical protein CMJ25_18385 [Phycisphaerae bacterium]|nr:hypothetical protein [Phycisphaerae bacterium]